VTFFSLRFRPFLFCGNKEIFFYSVEIFVKFDDSGSSNFLISRTLIHPHPGSGRNGSHGESSLPDVTELGLLRVHWIIGPPFVDRKSLTTMSNTGGVGG
jgi:hypothetical protein